MWSATGFYNWLTLLAYLLLPVLAIAIPIALRRMLARRRARRAARAAVQPCLKCGYELAGLEIPRCPECGTLVGFDKPLDELGLSDEEVRAGFARRRRSRR